VRVDSRTALHARSQRFGPGLWRVATGTVREVNLAEAAEITGLGEDEILWAIEEGGRCDTEAYIVVDAVDTAEMMAAL
jgi:hypothetical protein